MPARDTNVSVSVSVLPSIASALFSLHFTLNHGILPLPFAFALVSLYLRPLSGA